MDWLIKIIGPINIELHADIFRRCIKEQNIFYQTRKRTKAQNVRKRSALKGNFAEEFQEKHVILKSYAI